MIYSVTYWSDDEATVCEVHDCIQRAEVLVTSLMGDEDAYLCYQDWIVLRVRLVQSGNDIVGDVTMWDRRLSPGRGSLPGPFTPARLDGNPVLSEGSRGKGFRRAPAHGSASFQGVAETFSGMGLPFKRDGSLGAIG